MPDQDTCVQSKPKSPEQLPFCNDPTQKIKSGKKSESLSLDDPKNNCHPNDNFNAPESLKCCPDPVGHFRGVRHVEESKHIGVRVNIACKRWNCPYCGPKKVKRLIRRVLRGPISDRYQNEIKGGRPSKYQQKFLTLTAPGNYFRMTYTPKEALEEMNHNYHKLIRALKKRYGHFHYLKVVEPQRDGFPHFHVLLVGPGIAPRAVLQTIRDLWVDKYGMGNVDLQVIQKGIKAAVKYITKYITKEIRQICKGSRVFSSSRGALEPLPEKPIWLTSRFYIGRVHDLEDGKAEVLEEEFFPKMPKNLDWNRIKEGFRGELHEFMNQVVFENFSPMDMA